MSATNTEMTPLFEPDSRTGVATSRGDLHPLSRWAQDERAIPHRWYDGIPTMVVCGRMHRWVRLEPHEHTPAGWWPETGSEVRSDRRRTGWVPFDARSWGPKMVKHHPWVEAWENARQRTGEHDPSRAPIPDGLYILCGPNMGTEGLLEHQLMRTDEVVRPAPPIERAALASMLLERKWSGIWWLHPVGNRCIVTRADLGLPPVNADLPGAIPFERITTAAPRYRRGPKPRIRGAGVHDLRAATLEAEPENPHALRTEAEAEVQREAGLHEVRGRDAGDDGVPGQEGPGA